MIESIIALKENWKKETYTDKWLLNSGLLSKMILEGVGILYMSWKSLEIDIAKLSLSQCFWEKTKKVCLLQILDKVPVLFFFFFLILPAYVLMFFFIESLSVYLWATFPGFF